MTLAFTSYNFMQIRRWERPVKDRPHLP